MSYNGVKRAVHGVLVSVFALTTVIAPAWSAQEVTSTVKSSNPRVLFSCPRLSDKSKMTLDEMTQGLDGWFFRLTSDRKQEFRLMNEAASYLERFVQVMNARGTHVVFMSIPPRGVVGRAWLDTSNPDQKAYMPDEAAASYEAMLVALRKTGLIVPDMLALFMKDAPSEGVGYFFKRDHHWTSLGAQKAAEALAAALKDNPTYKQQTPAKFVTKQTSIGQRKHTMAMELQRLCDGDIPAEELPVFKTTMEATGADALFGDAVGGAPSALVGSSYSADEDFNFDGFIMQNTGLNIANYSISAGMLFNSLTSLTSDPQFETMKPPFLIWEAPSIYDLNTDSAPAFRQIIPGVYGKCKGDDVIATGAMDVVMGKGGVLLHVPVDKKVHGTGYYLVLDSSSRGFAKFTLQLDYDDGDGEWFTVDRSQYFNNNGRFFVELSDEIDSNLIQISLDGLDNVNTKLGATLCRVPASFSKLKASVPAATSAKIPSL